MSEKQTILCVDDEKHNLDALKRTLRKEYNILTALSGGEGLEIIKNQEIALIITDQRMPQMSGVEFLEKSVEIAPDVIRIILTGFTDVEDLIGAINTGQVYRYITKPWEPQDLKVTIQRAIESRDLTLQNKKLLDDVIRLEKLALVGQVASGIAHEVRNQLSSIMGIQLLQEKFPNDKHVERVANRLFRTKDRILNILNDIKSLGKQEQENLYTTPVLVNDLFTHVISIVELDPDVKKMTLIVTLDDCPPPLCNANKITQILINLIRNASHAMNGEGTIELCGYQQEDFVLLQVKDSGHGIPEDKMETIWQPFYTTKGDQGTGLGLSICKKIAEAHRGDLRCESVIGQGTTFTLALPVAS